MEIMMRVVRMIMKMMMIVVRVMGLIMKVMMMVVSFKGDEADNAGDDDGGEGVKADEGDESGDDDGGEGVTADEGDESGDDDGGEGVKGDESGDDDGGEGVKGDEGDESGDWLQVQQKHVDEEQLAKVISQKLLERPGVSFSEIASVALEHGRKQLAVKVSSL